MTGLLGKIHGTQRDQLETYLSILFLRTRVVNLGLDLKKSLDTICFVQGLELVVPCQCHSCQCAIARHANVSLTPDMFLVWE
jgi:hypothetical protein